MAREVSGKDWHWFYDRTASRPPYLLAVEEPQLPSIETIVEEVAGMLSSLSGEFFGEHPQLRGRLGPDRALGVFLFASRESYTEFQKRAPNTYPDPSAVDGFFKEETASLYLWTRDEDRVSAQGTPRDLAAVVFREGTRQLLHFCRRASDSSARISPWLQEGLSNYFSGYYTRIVPGSDPPRHEYRAGKSNRECYDAIMSPAIRSHQMGKPAPGILPLQELMRIDHGRFQRSKKGPDKNPVMALLVPAQGWAFVHFCKHFVKNGQIGFYRDRFARFLEAELDGRGGMERFAVLFGLESDRDWEALQREFFAYICDTKTGLRFYMYESLGRAPDSWPD